MKRRRAHESDGSDSPAWYVAEATRGQQLLDHGHVGQATEVFEGLLARLGQTPSYSRAVVLGRLGRCRHMGGRPDLSVRHLRDAIDMIGRLAPSDGVKGLRATLRSELGDALRSGGQYAEARKAYEAALKIAAELKDLRGQGVELGRLGALALTEGKLEDALAHLEPARQLFQQLHEPDMEAATWHQLGKVYHARRQWDEAERHYREAARISEECGRQVAASQTWNDLADLLQQEPGRLVEARRLAERAVAVAQRLDPTAVESWRGYGTLASIADREARAAVDGESRAALERQAHDYREVQRHAPIIFATLASVGESASVARAVLLGHLGRCLHMGRRSDLAVACFREALDIVATLPSSEGAIGLCGALLSDLGDTLGVIGHDADARTAHEAALTIAEGLQDVRGQAEASQRLGRAFHEPRQRDEAMPFEVTVHEALMTDYVFEPDLLVDGPHQRRTTR